MGKEAGRNIAFAAYRDLDERYRYDGKDLGAVCREGRTVFKVWSPLAERVELRLYRSDVSEAYFCREMEASEQGTWVLEFSESLHGIYYDYLVRRNGEDTRTADPYAVGCGCNGDRSMVVDLRQTDPEGFERDVPPEESGERIVYELHIKDFSYDMDSGVPEKYRGKYKAFTVSGGDGADSAGNSDSTDSLYSIGGTHSVSSSYSADSPHLHSVGNQHSAGMEYLKNLGVTHVHLLPFFDYGSVDEAGGEEQFNWGYDPVNYNVPEGSYATDTSDGTVRIRECKEMIQALHKSGLRVVMDVVYNHTHHGDSWLERMAPGYYYRHEEDGQLSNGSGCGNDIAAGRAMVDNYIADSVMYWAREYHIDGFRFDLMGLLTVELMNRIRRELDEAFGSGEKMLYGEPWSAGASPMETDTKAATKENVSSLDEGIAIFSDDTRDAIKGSVFNALEPGFVNGGTGQEEAILHGVTGWMDNGTGFAPKSCGQIVNYVSAHDNFTLWDKLVLSMHGEGADFSARYEDVVAANKLAAFIYFTCQGNLFLQAGEEFGRTKFGDDNSYRSAPELNMLGWNRIVEYGDLVEYYKGLIRLRRKLPGLCDKSPSAAERITQKEIHRAGVVSFRVDNRCSDGSFKESLWEELFVVYNASAEDNVAKLPEKDTGRLSENGGIFGECQEADCRKIAEDRGGNGRWEILADSQETDCRRHVEAPEEGIRVAAHSGMLLGKCWKNCAPGRPNCR